jgi:hypothetical protein
MITAKLMKKITISVFISLMMKIKTKNLQLILAEAFLYFAESSSPKIRTLNLAI